MSFDKAVLEQRYRSSALRMLKLCHQTASKHLSSSFSCLETLVYLIFSEMRDGDELLLSKGHAAPALYSVLCEKGWISDQEVQTFGKDGTRFPAHPGCELPDRLIRGIPFGTGSLGHGLSLAAGMALGKKWRGEPHRVFCVLSDGECQSGSIWEGALFAAQQRLSQLTVVIDRNQLQAFGRTEEVLALEPLVDKWRSFGFLVHVAQDGQNFESLDESFQRVQSSEASSELWRPRCIIAKTVKGGRISFMQDRLEWHYLALTDENYSQACTEILQGSNRA